jgi:nitroreductase
VVLQSAEARQQLGHALGEMLKERMPMATEEQLNAERGKPLRAPAIIVVAAKITKGKIPEIEQVAAVAAAVQNMFLAANALGYGAMWKTGGGAYNANIKACLGLAPEDHIVALLYLGTTAAPGTVTPVNTDDLTVWK